MLTLAQRIMYDGLRHSGSLEDISLVSSVREFIASSHNVIINNCYEYVQENDESFLVKELPSVMPFYDSLWFEYTREDQISVGVMLKRFKASTVEFKDSEYLLYLRIVIHVPGTGSPTLIPVCKIAPLNSSGKICGNGSQFFARSSVPGEDVDVDFTKISTGLTRPVMFALSLCHAMNVNEQDVSDKHNPKAKELKRSGQPKITYKVLEIEPAKRVLKEVGKVETCGIPKALHTVRGHFATYTKERPLFGRVAGTVWKTAHERGDIKNGAVIKDYAFKGVE